MTNIDPAALPDAEIARWMAERDGWRVTYDGFRWYLYKPDKDKDDFCYTSRMESDIAVYLLHFMCYPTSIDAAVGWLGRMGLGWMRYMKMDCVAVSNGTEWFICAESDTCSTARALCNAGAAAWLAREAGK